MICPRCAKEISDTETICPYCLQEINLNMEFNDFREDGYVQLQAKDDLQDEDPVSYKPKYFDISEANILVISVVFVLVVSVLTLFSLKFVQKEQKTDVPEYHSVEETTEPTTEIVNSIKNVTIKNLYGSWKLASDEELGYNAIPYFTFGKDGYIQENYGTMIATGEYKDLSEDGEPGVAITIDSGLQGEFDFDVSGNDDNGYTLTLVNRANGYINTYVKTQAQMKKLGTISGYRVDKRILGVWYTKDKKKAYKFVDNGHFKRITNNITIFGVFSIDLKGEVTIKYMKDEIKTVPLPYKISKDGKRLRLNGTVYFKK
ncbi:MAG: zinc ribbon domain-containing protein [Ruminococcus sp.]|nr:zinc ribbon domain-containing protein [Ruminococcus sp.]